MVSMRSSPKAVVAGDDATWDEEGRLRSILFTNAVNADVERGCPEGQRERVAERRVWYVVTRASAALGSVGVECSCARYMRLRNVLERAN